MARNIQDKLIVVLGPTASGKTDIAINLAQKYDGEIICADSRTIYKGMDIGTAKPSNEQMQGIKHYLLDVIEPNQSFSVVEFKTLCLKYINKIRQKGKLAIIVGGSGLYLDAVLFDYSFRSGTGLDTNTMSDQEKLEAAQKIYGKDLLGVDAKNIRRVEQLLERGPSNSADRDSLKIPCKIIGVKLEKPLLKQNVEKRTQQMLNNGFVQEVQKLRSRYGSDCASLQTTGYAQVGDYLDGKLEKDQLASAINAATLRLAKKQTTWFKRNPHIDWVADYAEASRSVGQYLSKTLVE
jgi:tRNA dimethylallyltransferase